MPLSRSDLTNLIGTHILPFTNPRVVSPPGRITPQGRPNIVVATPMRSGTHMLIDMILNNLPAYRNRPLYVDLDQCWKQEGPDRDLIGQITPDAGYVLKTHLPLAMDARVTEDPRIAALVQAGIVVTIRRDRDEVCRSLARWHGRTQPGRTTEAALADYAAQYDRFWEVWQDRPQIGIAFGDLFSATPMTALIDEIARRTGTRRAGTFRGPPRAGQSWIYTNKALTRLLGRHAPRIDTSIHTLKG